MTFDSAKPLVVEIGLGCYFWLALCTLLDKPERRVLPFQANYVGFTIPDAFVVGYGLDYCQQYRNMPYIGVLKPEVYSK